MDDQLTQNMHNSLYHYNDIYNNNYNNIFLPENHYFDIIIIVSVHVHVHVHIHVCVCMYLQLCVYTHFHTAPTHLARHH